MLNEVLLSIEEEFKHRLMYGTHKGKLAGNIIFSSKKRSPLGERVISEVRVSKDAREITLIAPKWLTDKYFGYEFTPYKSGNDEYVDLYATNIPLVNNAEFRPILKSIQFLVRNTF